MRTCLCVCIITKDFKVKRKLSTTPSCHRETFLNEHIYVGLSGYRRFSHELPHLILITIPWGGWAAMIMLTPKLQVEMGFACGWQVWDWLWIGFFFAKRASPTSTPKPATVPLLPHTLVTNISGSMHIHTFAHLCSLCLPSLSATHIYSLRCLP